MIKNYSNDTIPLYQGQVSDTDSIIVVGGGVSSHRSQEHRGIFSTSVWQANERTRGTCYGVLASARRRCCW